MSVYIENQYKNIINIDYQNIIRSVVDQSIKFVGCPYECEVNVTITDNDTIGIINMEQRNMDKPTDVLSFPFLEYDNPGDLKQVENDISCFNPDTGELILGDIVISYDKVISQSCEYNHSQKRELAFLTAHSMLHLFGYDHMEDEQRNEMEKYQNIILNDLKITRED